MNIYKLKISIFEWCKHISGLVIAVFAAVLASHFNEKPGASFGQALIHIIIVSAAILDLFILYRKKNAVIELDKYGLRYYNFRAAHNINFTDITKIERNSFDPETLTLTTPTRNFIIPLKIENKDEFLKNITSTLEAIKYRIEYSRDNLLSGKIISKTKNGDY